MLKNLNGRNLPDSPIYYPASDGNVSTLQRKKIYYHFKKKIAMPKNYVTYAYTIISSLGENRFSSMCSAVLKSVLPTYIA